MVLVDIGVEDSQPAASAEDKEACGDRERAGTISFIRNR